MSMEATMATEPVTVAIPSSEAIDAVLRALNEVFAGNIEYDEAFERLQIYPSKVRRDFPALYLASKNPPNLEKTAVMAVLDDSTLHDFETMLTNMLDGRLGALAPALTTLLTKSLVDALPKPQIIQQIAPPQLQQEAQPPQAQGLIPIPEPNPETNEGGMRIYDYQAWAQQVAYTSQLNQQWALRWDVQGVPFPTQDAIYTLRTQRGRIRFQVTGFLDGQTLIFKTIAFPPNEG